MFNENLFNHYYPTSDYHTGPYTKRWRGYIFSFFDGITMSLLSKGALSCSSTVGPWLLSASLCFEVKNWRIFFFVHFLIILMGLVWAPEPQKDAHGQRQIVLVKQRVKMSPWSRISGNSWLILSGVVFKTASVPQNKVTDGGKKITFLDFQLPTVQFSVIHYNLLQSAKNYSSPIAIKITEPRLGWGHKLQQTQATKIEHNNSACPVSPSGMDQWQQESETFLMWVQIPHRGSTPAP